MQSSSRHSNLSRRNPFYEEPLQRAFYHPSRNIHIDTESATIEKQEDENVKLSPSSKRFLKAGNMFSFKSPPTGVSPGDTSSKFDESWPTSERPSTIDIPDYLSPESHPNKLDTEKGSLALLLKDKPWLAALIKSDPVKSRLSFEMQPERDDNVVNKESTLSKYIARFRQGTPMSRDERTRRDHVTNPSDFWWLEAPPGERDAGTPADSSTPRDDRVEKPDKARLVTDRRPLVRESYDDDTELLQSKADMLLESASSLNTSDPIVSTVGLGSEADTTQYSSSSFSEKTFRPEFIKKQIEKDPLTMRRSKKPLHPEDDILAQWRMMRRRELAHAGLKPATTGPAAAVRQQSTKQKLHASTGLNSKLQEFRGQLTRAAHGVFEQPITGRETGQPISGQETEQSVLGQISAQTETRQSTADQHHGKVTETACQTSPVESTSPIAVPPVRRRNQAHSSDPEVPPTQVRPPQSDQEDSQATPSHGERRVGPPGGEGGGHVIIASPAIKYKMKASRGGAAVEPHYHLPCDVIPWQLDHDHCCHGCYPSNVYKHCDYSNNSNKGKQDQRDSRKSKSRREETSDFDSDYEVYKQKHMKYLEKEFDINRSKGQERGRGQSRVHGHSGSRFETPERDGVHEGHDPDSEGSDSETGVTQSMQDLKLGHRMKVGQGKLGQKKDNVCHYTKRSRVSHLVKDKDSEGRNEGTENEQKKKVGRKDKVLGEDLGHGSGVQSEDVSENGYDVSQSKENENRNRKSKGKRYSGSENEKLRRRGDKREKEKVVPKRSKSPAGVEDGERVGVRERRNEESREGSTRGWRPGIGSTIGQVITDRLFAGSPLSVRASVESETSLRFPPTPDPVPGVEALLCSDEEDYIQDEILRDLRAKRNMYVHRLQAIEAILQEK